MCGSAAGALIDDDLNRIGGVLRVYRRAATLFGSRMVAERWLCSVQPALGGHTPLQAARTERGAAAVERLLTRIVRGEA